MTQLNQAHDKRNQKLKQVWDAVTAEFPKLATEFADTDEVMAALWGRLVLARPSLEQLRERRKTPGAILKKNELEEALIAKLVRYANALRLRLKKEGDLETAEGLYLRRSEYGLLTQQELVEEAEAVLALAQARKGDLGGANIKPADITALGTEVEAYRQSLPVYKVAVENAKVGGKTVRLVFKDNNAFIADDVRSAIELLSDDYPTAYQRLLEALRIDDPSTKRKKRGSKPTDGGGTASPA